MNTARTDNALRNSLDPVSTEVKNFFSAGTTFTLVGSAGTVDVVWSVLRRVSGHWADHELVCLVLSIGIVLAYALVLPEPSGYPNATKFRITLAELIFGVINAFVICGVVIGIRNGLAV